MKPLEIIVLVSIGRHPVSGRERRAVNDARALAVARSLTDRSHIKVVHAGDPDSPVLAEYLGIGADCIEVLPVPAGCDVMPGLAHEIETRKPDLVLTASQAERGRASGLLPYALAKRAGLELAPGASSIDTTHDGEFRIQQALPGGQRRALAATPPLLATVDATATAVPPFVYARSRRGEIRTLEPPDEMPALDELDIRPARRRPKRINVGGGNQSAAERLRAAAGTQSAGGQQIEAADPEKAADAIIDFLRDKKVLRPASEQ